MPDNISALWLTKSTSYVNHFYSSGKKNPNQGNGTKLCGRSPQREKQPRSNTKMLYLEVFKSKKKTKHLNKNHKYQKEHKTY